MRLHPVHNNVAANRVLAKKHALWPAIDFDGLNVENIDQLPSAGTHLNTVDNHSDLWALGFLNISIADASNIQGACPRACRIHADVDVRHKAIKVAQGVGFDLFNGFFAESGNRQRYILHGFIFPPRGHNNLFHTSTGFLGEGKGCNR